MIRHAFTFLLLLSIAGCRTAGHDSQSATFGNQLRDKTAQILQPLMPDMGKNCGESDSTTFAGTLAPNHSHSSIVPVSHSSNSLYKPGSIVPAPILALREQDTNTISVETAANVASTYSNPLQIQAGDSEAFQSLLREIAVVPTSKRKVDDARLSELLTSFRSETMDTDLEDEYLALLKKRILPEAKSSAPIPNVELAETKRPSRKYEVAYDEEIDDEPIQAPKRKLPNLDETAIAQKATETAPVYPNLTQIPSASPGVIQASYQTLYPPTPAIAGYGAGDWQAPTRLAIEQLRYAIEQTPNGRTVSNEMRLRLLEMLLGNKTEAAKPMLTADKTVNEFMGNQVLGFAALLDDTAPDRRGKYISAAYRFNEGLLGLQTLCPVKLKNVVFVKEWFGYGQFVPHATQEFYPGETFSIYMEVENPVVRRAVADEGFEINAALSYEIRDANAKIIVSQDAGKPGERTLSRKRDYYLVISNTLPANLPPGQYRLRVSLTDLNDDAMQYAEETISFRVVPSQVTEF